MDGMTTCVHNGDSVASELAAIRGELARMAREISVMREALPPMLVSVKEAAHRLGISEQTVRRRIKSGELPSTRIGTAVRIDLARLRGLTAEDIARRAANVRAPVALRRAA